MLNFGKIVLNVGKIVFDFGTFVLDFGKIVFEFGKIMIYFGVFQALIPNSAFKNGAVNPFFCAATSSGVPVQSIVPPPTPPSGPMSMM